MIIHISLGLSLGCGLFYNFTLSIWLVVLVATISWLGLLIS